MELTGDRLKVIFKVLPGVKCKPQAITQIFHTRVKFHHGMNFTPLAVTGVL